MIKAQLKNLIKTIHLVKEAGFSLLVFSIAISLFQGILPIFSMLLVQKMLNIITTDIKNFHTLMIAFISYIALTLLTIIIGEVDSYIDTKLQILLHYKMNHLVMQKTVKLTLAEFETPEIYDDITRIQNQISYKPFQIYKSIISVLSSLVSLISSFVILLNWKISIFPLLLILPIVSIYIYLKIGKNEFEILYKRSSDERANWYISHLLTHDFAVKELRLGTLESYFLKKYDKNNQLFINQENSINRSKMKYGIVLGVLEIAIQSIIMFLAVREAFLGILLVGNVTTFIRSLSTMQTSTQNIVNNIYSFYNGSLYMELLYDFTHDELVHNPIIESTVDTIQSVEFERVSFSYNGKDNVINDISFSIKAGERLAIVGENGSGKSTIFKLACGLYDNYEGNIYINGINLRSIQKKSYYKRISALFQDFLKYELTLRENVGLGELSKLYSDEDLISALKYTGVDSIFYFNQEKLNQIDLEQQLGNWFEDGRQLSGGQWQKIALSRVYLKEADCYLLDEPSSALDPESETKIFKTFFELSQNKIGIFITHKPSITQSVNKILYLDNGYLPFCDWLFFKFYGPKERQEELLNNWKKFWLNLPSELFSQSNMFYMRYNDTNDHIRIRINCDSIENNFSLYLSVVQDLLPQLIESCIISDIEVSSYKPEVNRYGGPHLISYAEEIFCKESILFLNNTIEFSDDERLVCATYLVLYYLNHFFKDKETRRSFLFENYTGKYKKDFKNLPIDLPIEYMKSLNGVTSALDRYDFFQEMDRYLMSYMKEYNRFGGTNDIYNTKFNLVGSFLHLSMNRLNGIDREFEEKVYCFAYYTLNAQQYIEWE
ncbi:TPA: thiopeptide-type bacteriocin biosynthesis protein [Streptococcus pyogenes]|uniref:thiopeptide-type bacteriocin biosynthesis protein n=5 Tax=Streptococcus pyogenes TaxID=1314 RepID=UPI001F512AF7|nr:thiopeptide-type bacteriocin biosynthesis protein [Streptococcus pyogenes]